MPIYYQKMLKSFWQDQPPHPEVQVRPPVPEVQVRQALLKQVQDRKNKGNITS